MIRAVFVAFAILSTGYAAPPDGHSYDRSPSGEFLIVNHHDPDNSEGENYISIARRDQPMKSYRIYTYPRLVDLYFSPGERYLVIDDHNGSGWNRVCGPHTHRQTAFFVKRIKVDERAWKLFWSQHRRPRKITYGHRQTYLCEWLDSSRFVLGLQGNSDFDAPKWYLDGGWHCIYDAARSNVYTDKYTDSKNAQFELSID